MQWSWNKTSKHKANSLIQPKRKKQTSTTKSQIEIILFSGKGSGQECNGSKSKYHKGPHKWYKIVVYMTVMLKAKEKIFQRMLVTGNVGVVSDKELKAHKKHIQNRRINNNGHQLIHCLSTGIKTCNTF